MSQINFEVLNIKNTPSMAADLFANRPTIAATGSLFISSDTFKFYRFNGSTWDLIGDGGITGNLTTGYIPIATGTGTLGDSNISYTATPGGIQEGVFNTNPNISYVTQISATTLRAVGYDIADGTSTWNFQRVYESAVPYNEFYSARTDVRYKLFNGIANTFHTLFQNGNVSFGNQVDAGYKVDIQGTLRSTGTATVGNLVSTNNIQVTNVLYGTNFWQQADGGTRIGSQSAPVNGTMFQVSGSKTAVSGSARGQYISNTLVASANNDILAALEIVPTFTNGSFTGVANYGVKVTTATNDSITLSGSRINFTRTFDGAPNTAIFKNGTTTSVGLTFAAPNGGNNGFQFQGSGFAELMNLNASTFNVQIGTTTDAGYKLDVNGTLRTTNTITTTQINIGNVAGSGHVFCRVNDNGTPLRTVWNYSNTSSNTWVNGSEVASSLFTLNSTTLGFLPPRMTTTQKNAIASPVAGLVVYDTTLNKLCVYTTAWQTITSA